MFNKYSENKFKKKFPGLMQVINEQPIAFDLYGQVPLRFGPNQVYLLANDGKRTVYTDFTVEDGYKYGLKIVYNYPYVIDKIKRKFIIMFLATMLGSFLLEVLFITVFPYIFLVTLGLSLIIYYFSVEYFINQLGISAYKIEVVSNKR